MINDDLHCDEFVEMVTAYMDGALPDDAVHRIDEHLAICPPCRDYLTQMRLTIARLGTLPADPVSPAVRRSLLAAFTSWKAERTDGEAHG